MARRYAYSCKTEEMEYSIAYAFQSMVEQKEFKEALDFIGACINKVPHYNVLRIIIFKILMDKDCCKKVAVEAVSYLENILTIYPPSDFNHRLYYKGALISGNNAFPNSWAAFCHFVESSFCHHKIFREEEGDDQMRPVQYPNCDILVEFYVKVFLDSYEYLSCERTFYEKGDDSKEKALVSELFWPSESSELSAAQQNPIQFLSWINSIYEHMARIEKISVFRSLHQLFNLMVKCIIADQYIFDKTDILTNRLDSLICNSSCLIDIVKVIMNTCKEAFVSHESLRRFMNHISLKYLQIKVCEYRLYELIYSRQPSERNSSPCTLKDIINVYMFHNPGKKRGRKKKQKTTECKAKPMKHVLKLNRKENSEQKLIFDAADEDGLTPLHIAVQNNVCDIAKMIIKKGGSHLLGCVDNSGRQPHHYCGSVDMEKLLQEFQLPDSDTEDSVMKSISSLSIPNLDSFRKYALFFHAVHFFLTYYSDVYHLCEASSKMKKGRTSLIQVHNHEDKTCPHYASCPENVVCSVDFEYLKHLPDIVNHFYTCAIECSKEKNLNLDLELLPLQLYVASLQ